jgi:hypothetical protein
MLPERRMNITDETRELLAEGKRRQREYEGMAPTVAKDGKVIGFMVEGEAVPGCIGTRKGIGAGKPMAEAFLEAAAQNPEFFLYLPSNADEKGLQQELADLNRDVERMIQHEKVKYDE